MTDAIVDCYRGCCELCTEHSYVCSQEKPWFRKYLEIYPDLRRRRAFIRPQSEDLTKLRNMIAIRLGPGAIHKTVTHSTQNKCEAANRGIKKAVPGHITHRRNYSGRVHSAVQSMNHGIGKSTMELCEAASAPIRDASSVGQVLKTMDKRMKYQQQYKRSNEYKERRRARVQENFKMYEKKETQQGYSRYGALEDVVPALYIPQPDWWHLYKIIIIRRTGSGWRDPSLPVPEVRKLKSVQIMLSSECSCKLRNFF